MGNLYLYFSGTGNTKYVVNKFSSLYEENEYIKQSIEHKDFDYNKSIKEAEIIIIAHPVHGSMLPFIMSEFLSEYKESFKNKNIITLVTQMYFSGDGGALAYYKLKSVNVNLLFSIHINMPNNITNIFLFKSLTLEQTTKITSKADIKIENIVRKIKQGKKIKMGHRFFSWTLGYFTQRGINKLFMKAFRKRLYIHHDKCITCLKCISICPMGNLYLEDNKIKTKNKCTLCYRCINACPTQAISLFIKATPKIQYIRDDLN